MNWYKKAEKKNNEWKWKNFILTFGLTAVAGLISFLGINNIDSLKNNYIQNPQNVEQKMIEYQNSSTNTQDINNTQEPEVSEAFEVSDNNPSDNSELAQMIERHEGSRSKVYIDTMGIPTIGIGFNLNRPDAREKIEEIGADYNSIINGRESLTDQQINILFQHSLKEATSIAQSFLPNFNEHPEQVQFILIDMAFNLGPNRLAEFRNFKQALLNKNYSLAASEMVNSQWYNQVGNRSRELVNMMRNN